MRKLLSLILACVMFYASGMLTSAEEAVANTDIGNVQTEEIMTETEHFMCAEDYGVAPSLLHNLMEIDSKLQSSNEAGIQPNVLALEGTNKVLTGAGATPTPSEGDINLLVIMVEFADVKFAEDFTPEYVENLMFAPQDTSSRNYPKESVNAWYQRSSYGKLRFHGEVQTITLENTREYYTYDENNNPEGELKYRQEIFNALRNMEKDWSEYDSNGDYFIDSLCLVVAGKTGDWASQWWSHAFLGNIVPIDENYYIGTYMECMESHMKNNDPATVIHEMGHCLGLPDLYNTETVGQQSGGIHTTDMMSNNAGDFNALCKMLLGWIDTDRIQMVEHGSNLSTISLDSYTSTGDCALLFVDDTTTSIFGEYYLVQYMDFAENATALEWLMQDEHLQIYHVNAELTEDGNAFLHDNRKSGDCKLIEAVDKDGEYLHGECSSSWFYEETVYSAIFEDEYNCGYLPGDELTPYTTPSTGKYATDRLEKSADEFSGLNIKNITIAGGAASFDVFYEEEPGQAEEITLEMVADFQSNSYNGQQAQIIANHDIWFNNESGNAYIREKDSMETIASVALDMQLVWPFCSDYFVGHNSLGVTVDTSVTLDEDTEYEIVFPAGMFITSYGEISEEIICSGINQKEEAVYPISGAIQSSGDEANNITLRLLQDSAEVTSVETTDGTYQFTGVSDGTYTLEISKANHVTRTYEITVDGSELIQDLEIRLIGDITGDGAVNTRDWNRMYAHINETSLLTDYDLLCADVMGSDGNVNVRDWNRLYAHINETNPLW